MSLITLFSIVATILCMLTETLFRTELRELKSKMSEVDIINDKVFSLLYLLNC